MRSERNGRVVASGREQGPPVIEYEKRIRQAHADLSPSFAMLADFLLDAYDEAAFLTGTEVAHRLDLDPATVVRFAQRLGYPGYPELQRELQNKVRLALSNHEPAAGNTPAAAVDSGLRDAIHVLEHTRRTFPMEAAHAFLDALDQAKRIIFLAEGLALPAAHNLAAWLEAGGYTIHIGQGSAPDVARTLAGIRRNDLVLAIEIRGESALLSRALAEAGALGAKTVAVVAAPSLRSAQKADIVFAAYASEDAGVGQVGVQAIILGLFRLLRQARPGRFGELDQRTRKIMRSLSNEING